MTRRILHILLLMMMSLPELLLAQDKPVVVKGTVLDQETNETIIGATVLLSGSPVKSLGRTDVQGRFTVSVPDGATLIFRYVGYQEQKVKLKPGQHELTVTIIHKNSLLDEVVVRGYQNRTREQDPGSSIIVSGKEVQDVPVSSVEELLQGKVPGLNIQDNTGAPGYRGTVAIRGVSGIDVSGTGDQSYLTPTSPLYVIDGIPVEADAVADFGYNSPGPGVSPLSMIPPEDISSIEVLKDVQATSLYGSRGAYGVIIITTKRGSSPKPRVHLTSMSFLNTPPGLRTTLGGKSERDYKLSEILAMGTYNDLLRVSSTPILSDSLNAYYRNSTNWQGIFYGTTFNTKNNVSIDGGDNKFNYKTNIGYYTENGIIQNTGFDSYTMSINMDYRPDNKFHMFFTVTGGLGQKSKGSGQGVFQTGVANSASASSLLPGPSLFQATAGTLANFIIADANNSKNIRPGITLEYQLFKDLRFTGLGSYDYSTNTETTLTPAEVNSFSLTAVNSNTSVSYSYNDHKATLYGRGGFIYNHGFAGGTHNLNINSFSEIYVKDFQAGYITQKGTPNDQIVGPLGAAAYYSYGGGVLKSFHNEHSVSFATSVNYDYKKKYILSVTGRLDGSSLSGFDNPFAKNFSVAAKWNFSKEPFLSQLRWLTFGDIRLSTGKNVQRAGDIYSLYGTYLPNGNYYSSQRVTIDYSKLPNSVLSPPTTNDINFGLDFGLFNGKAEVVFDTYYRRVLNLQRTITLPTMTGFANVLSDGASLIDYGYELSLSFRPLSEKSKVSWFVQFNGALNKDFLTSLPGGRNLIISGSTVLKVGRNTFSNYLLNNQGVYSTDAQVPVDPVTGLKLRASTNSTAFFKAGDPIWQDVNGDFVIDDNDKQVLGNSQPMVTGGVNTTVSYKHFSVNIAGSYTFKRDIINAALSSRLTLANNPFNANVILPLSDLNYWKKPGDVAVYPNPFDYTRSGIINPFRYDQTLFQESGSYFKINTITISYSINNNWVQRLGLSNLRFFVSGKNIYTFSGYSGPNPENVTAAGYDASGGYPVARVYNLGVNIDF